MKSGFWHLPAKVIGAVFLVVAVSGLAITGASSFAIDGAKSVPAAREPAVSIERVDPPEGGRARIASDRLSFTLDLPPEGGNTLSGTFDLINITDNDVIVDVTVGKPDSVLIDFVDPLYDVSGQSGRNHWRLYTKQDGVSIVRYLVKSGTDINPGSYQITVSLIPDELYVGYTPVPIGQRMWGGDLPATTAPPGVVYEGWPMFRYNPRHTGRSIYSGLAFHIIDVPFTFSASSPSIAPDGTIYVSPGNQWFFALDSDGIPVNMTFLGGDIHSSPAIAPDGTVYVGAYDGNLYSLSSDFASVKSYATGGPIFSSPVIVPDGTVYAGSFDNFLYAFNPDLTFKWRYDASGNIYSSPAVAADGTIYFGSSDDNIYALNPDGTKKWSYLTGDVVHSSPAVAPDGTVYIGSADNSLYAMNPDGTKKWSYATGGRIDSSPAIADDGTVYFGSYDGNFYALKPDGTAKWIFTPPMPWPNYSSPAIGADGIVYFAATYEWLYGLNPGDGSISWSSQVVNHWFFSSPVIAPDGKFWFIQRDLPGA